MEKIRGQISDLYRSVKTEGLSSNRFPNPSIVLCASTSQECMVQKIFILDFVPT